MTNDAQSALRRVIEIYSKTSRFCLICNNINKIIPALKSRCTQLRFGYLKSTEISNKLSSIISGENVKIEPEALIRLINMNKDFRQILNTLQCIHVIKLNSDHEYLPIKPDEINEYMGVPTDTDIISIADIITKCSFHQACIQMLDLYKDNQWNLSDIIHKLTENVIKNIHLPDQRKHFIIDRMSDIEFKLSHSNDVEVQLYAMISAFQQSNQIACTGTL
jgi:replication factor C subunit 3/5